MTGDAAEAPESHDGIEGVPPPPATTRLFGHRGPWQDLVAAHRSGRLHHGWLFQGPRGIGKATAAFAFARYLLAAGEGKGAGDEPVSDAGTATARQIAGGSHPNLVHITRPTSERGPGFKTQITVDEIRKLNRFFRTTTGGGQWRIAIIDPADDMNRNAANALLKILEEPPERAVFLITNHLPGRLLATIRSRCRVLRFDPLPDEDMRAALGALGAEFAGAAIDGVLSAAGGSMRTALSLAASGGLEFRAALDRILDQAAPDWLAIQALADGLTAKGREAAFEQTVAAAFRRLGEDAERALAQGDGAAASALATLWMSESARFREGLAYNLDRKQMLMTFFHAVFDRRLAQTAA